MTFRTLQILDSDQKLQRVLKTQSAAGFDLFTASAAGPKEVPALFLSQASENDPKITNAAPLCFVQKTEIVPDGCLFEDAVTLSEFLRENQNPAVVATALHAVFQVLVRLDAVGISLRGAFHPEYAVLPKSNSSWCFLPVSDFVQHPSSSQNTSSSSFYSFFTWAQQFAKQFAQQISQQPPQQILQQIQQPFPETLQTLFRLGSDPEFTSHYGWKLFQNAALWSVEAPPPSFLQFRTVRKGSELTLHWKNSEQNTVKSAKSPYVVRLFELSAAQNPALRSEEIFPSALLSEFFQTEIPHQSTDTEGARTIFLKGNQFLRLYSVCEMGAWARAGRVFRVGGPEDTKIYDAYWDDDVLVLDFEWPEEVKRVKIVASPEPFSPAAASYSRSATNSEQDSGRNLEQDLIANSIRNSNLQKIWWFDKQNPLNPKRIIRSEFKGWKTIFIQLYSYVDEEGVQSFSLGRSNRSRIRISNNSDAEL